MKNRLDTIYIQPNAHDRWFEGNKPNNNFVEYIRKDAFIKKMQDWIKNRAESFIVDTPVFPYFDYKKAIEDFKEYMEE